MAWAVFVLLVAGYIYASVRFIPALYRAIYRHYSKDASYWYGNLLPHLVWIVAALESAISPTTAPLGLRIVGALLFIIGGGLIIAARRINPLFIAPIVHVPLDMRVRNGVYRYFSHPGYYGGALAVTGVYFLLAQFWAIIPVVIYLSVLLYRIYREQRILSQP